MNLHSKHLFLALNVAFWAVILCVFVAFGFQDFKELKKLQVLDLPPLEVGDLVFRRGDSIESVIISQISQHHYTHLGLLISSNPPLIIHATTDDDQSKPNQVIISSLEDFIARATSLAIKRFSLTSAQKDSILLNAKAQLGKAFIISDKDDAFYCTIFIEDLLTPHIKLNLVYDKISLPTLSGEYLFPKAFFDSPKATLIYEEKLFETHF